MDVFTANKKFSTKIGVLEEFFSITILYLWSKIASLGVHFW